jgi:putative transposase
MLFISKSFKNENSQIVAMPDAALMRQMFGERISSMLSSRGIAVETVRYHSPELENAYAKHGAKKIEVFWDPEDLGAVSVLLDGTLHVVPSVLDWFSGVSIDAWMSMRWALHDISDAEHADFQAAVAA